MLKWLVISGILILGCSTSLATVYHVPGDSDSIQVAINLTSDGDTVLVSPGSYFEYINFNGHNIVLASLYLTTGDSSYIATTILDGQRNGKLITFYNGEDSTAVVCGFTIRQGMAWFGNGAGIYIVGSAPTICHNIIRDCVAFDFGGGIYSDHLSPIIRDNVIIGNHADYGGGIYCDMNSVPIIENNDICGNVGRFCGGGLYLNESEAILDHNTIAGNTADSAGGGIYLRFCQPTVSNSIIYDNEAPSGSQIHFTGGMEPVVSWSDIMGGWSGEGNIDTMPFLVSPVDTNYALCSQSPCIDAGDSTLTDPDMTRTDIGKYRPDHETCSIGKLAYVAITGSDDTGDGSFEKPYRTIQHGIDATFSGDTVLVEGGRYFENVSFRGRPITVASRFLLSGDSYHVETTIIDGDSAGSVVTFDTGEDSSSVIVGFTITNGFHPSSGGGGIRCYETSPVIQDNVVTGNFGVGVKCGGSTYMRPRPRIERNIIANNIGGSGISAYLSKPQVFDNLISNNTAGIGGGICLFSTQARFSGNIIIDNYAATKGGGVYDGGYLNRFNYNTIANNTTDSIGGGYYAGNASSQITNCTFSGNEAFIGGGLAAEKVATPVVTSSVFWGNQADSVAEIFSNHVSDAIVTWSNVAGGYDGEGNIDEDPLFCDAPAMDFQLAELSPCLGSGLDGADIGAFGVGCTTTDIGDPIVSPVPTTFTLSQNRPNPFNPSTVIEYSLPAPAKVTITIHNILGQQINTLTNTTEPAGSHSVVWDGTNRHGNEVASGVYFYRVVAGNEVAIRKMVLVR